MAAARKCRVVRRCVEAHPWKRVRAPRGTVWEQAEHRHLASVVTTIIHYEGEERRSHLLCGPQRRDRRPEYERSVTHHGHHCLVWRCELDTNPSAERPAQTRRTRAQNAARLLAS